MKLFYKAVGILSLLGALSGCAEFSKQLPTILSSRPENLHWKAIGPGVGGALFAIAYHPGNSDIILAGTDMGGLFRTDNGGKTWKILGGAEGNQPGYRGAWNAVFDYKHPNIAWTASEHGVYKSIDTGKSWKRMTASITGEPLSFNGIAIDPNNSDIVYICQGWAPRGIKKWAKGRVWKTLDGGKTWKELPRPGGPLEKDKCKSRNYTCIVIDPNSKSISGKGHSDVYVCGRGGIFKSGDAGKTWKDLSANFKEGEMDDLICADVKGKSVLLATAHPKMIDPLTANWKGGVFMSEDAGKTWKEMNRGLEKSVRFLAKQNRKKPKTRGFSMMLTSSPAKPERIYLGCIAGIFRSDDLGVHWEKMVSSNRDYLKCKDFDGSETYFGVRDKNTPFKRSYKGGIDHFNRIAAAPGNADIVAFTDNVTVTQSIDGGKTWNDIIFDYGAAFDKGRFGDRPPMMYTNKIRARGLQVINSSDMAVDPFDPETIYVAYYDLGVRISRDGGKWWEYRSQYISGARNRTQARSIICDPDVKGTLYLSTADSGKVYISRDSGKTWKETGIEPLTKKTKNTSPDDAKEKMKCTVWELVLDPKSPKDSRTIYAASNAGIFKTEDGGKTWKECSDGLESSDVLTLAINPQNTKILYAGNNPKNKKKNNKSLGLYKTEDGGKTWKRLASDKLGAVRSISICANTPDTVYVVANKPGQNGSFWDKASLWRTDNGGNSWYCISGKRSAGIAVNPYDPDYIYYSIFAWDLNKEKVEIMRSCDGGDTWDDIGNGIALSIPKAFYIAPKNPKRIFLRDVFTIYEGMDQAAPTE